MLNYHCSHHLFQLHPLLLGPLARRSSARRGRLVQAALLLQNDEAAGCVQRRVQEVRECEAVACQLLSPAAAAGGVEGGRGDASMRGNTAADGWPQQRRPVHCLQTTSERVMNDDGVGGVVRGQPGR